MFSLRLIFVFLVSGFFAASVSAAEVMVLCAGDTRGDLWPCDCRVPGGLVKRATALRDLRTTAQTLGAAAVTVDLGHLMEAPLGDDAGFDRLLLRTMGTLGIDAMVLGPDDFPASDERLAEVCAALGIPVLSDLVPADVPWPTHRVSRAGVEIALLGWPRDRLEAVGDLTPLAAAIAELGDVCDFVVLISPLPDMTLRPALDPIEGIDAVVCRATPDWPAPTPEWDRGRLWATVRDGGAVGCLHVTLDAANEITAFSFDRTLLLEDVEDDPEIVRLALAQEEPLSPTDTTTSVIDETSRPASLRIETSGLEWDDVARGEVVRGTLTLVNEGDEPLGLRNIRSTCRCIRIGEHEMSIPGGASQTVEVFIDTNRRQPGEVSERLILTCQDRQRPVRSIAIRGNIH